MQLKDSTLAALFATILVARPVESSRRGGAGESVKSEPMPSTSLVPLTIQVIDHVAPSRKKWNKNKKSKKHLSKPLTEQETSLASVSKEDPIASSPEVQSFIKAIHSGDMDAALTLFYGGNSKLKKYCGKYLVGLGIP